MESDRQRPRLRYRDAGVDIDAQDEALRRIRAVVAAGRRPGVLADIGAFGGLFRPDLGAVQTPILVASCDGVGTKLKVAFETGVHDTVGRDLVHHCVNDILVQGAFPLFFMDYVATGRLDPAVLVSVVEGIARGCSESGCALLGGETAEMPGFYADGEYDVAGFIVGLLDRPRLIDGTAIRVGDVVLGLPSAGLHTNGFSLARKILFEVAGHRVDERVEALGATVGEVLLAEHRSYLKPLRLPVEEGRVRGLAHVTGGGLTDNLPRILPEGTAARIRRKSWPVPKIFSYLQARGGVDDAEMLRTFNMGIGMAVVVGPDEVAPITRHWDGLGQAYHRIGEIVGGNPGVIYA